MWLFLFTDMAIFPITKMQMSGLIILKFGTDKMCIKDEFTYKFAQNLISVHSAINV